MDIPDYTDEPFEWYKKMRKESPIIRSGNTIHVFKYMDISEVLSNYHVYSSQFRDLLGGELAEMMNQKTGGTGIHLRNSHKIIVIYKKGQNTSIWNYLFQKCL